MNTTPPPSFTCPRCGARSVHPKDVEQGYGGRCHDWTRQMQMQDFGVEPDSEEGVALPAWTREGRQW